MKYFLSVLLLFVFSQNAYSQKRAKVNSRPYTAAASDSRMTYDLSVSFGTYNSKSYNEATLGLNWILADWFTWRNAAFSRFGNDIKSVSGLDTSARFQTDFQSDDGGMGLHAFLGPGLRLATENYNAAFGEAGLIFKLGGLRLGGGVKSLYYFSDRTDSSTGTNMPKNENQIFLILSGSGSIN